MVKRVIVFSVVAISLVMIFSYVVRTGSNETRDLEETQNKVVEEFKDWPELGNKHAGQLFAMCLERSEELRILHEEFNRVINEPTEEAVSQLVSEPIQLSTRVEVLLNLIEAKFREDLIVLGIETKGKIEKAKDADDYLRKEIDSLKSSIRELVEWQWNECLKRKKILPGDDKIGLAQQIINRSKVDWKFDPEKDPKRQKLYGKCVGRLISEDTFAIQIPVVTQKGLQCGNFTEIVTELLARCKTIDGLLFLLKSKKIMRPLVVHTKKFISKHKEMLTDEKDKYKGEYIDIHYFNAFNSWEDWLNKNILLMSSALVDGSDGIHRTVITTGTTADTFETAFGSSPDSNPLNRWAATDNPRPEVFIVNELGQKHKGKHYFSLMVERLENGNIAIVMVDSLYFDTRFPLFSKPVIMKRRVFLNRIGDMFHNARN